MGYYRLADTPSVFQELDEWLRHRLRQLLWKRWKRPATRYRELVARGVPDVFGPGSQRQWQRPVATCRLHHLCIKP